MEINTKFQNSNILKSGFTLVELMVAMSIFLVIVGLGTNAFFSILKSSAKAKILKEARQNGDYALLIITQMIREAKGIKENSQGKICETNMGSLKISNKDGGMTELACLYPKIASNSGSLISDEVKITTCRFDCVSGSNVVPAKVNINFTLTQAAAEARAEETVSLDFKTTVSLRNP